MPPFCVKVHFWVKTRPAAKKCLRYHKKLQVIQCFLAGGAQGAPIPRKVHFGRKSAFWSEKLAFHLESAFFMKKCGFQENALSWALISDRIRCDTETRNSQKALDPGRRSHTHAQGWRSAVGGNRCSRSPNPIKTGSVSGSS